MFSHNESLEQTLNRLKIPMYDYLYRKLVLDNMGFNEALINQVLLNKNYRFLFDQTHLIHSLLSQAHEMEYQRLSQKSFFIPKFEISSNEAEQVVKFITSISYPLDTNAYKSMLDTYHFTYAQMFQLLQNKTVNDNAISIIANKSVLQIGITINGIFNILIKNTYGPSILNTLSSIANYIIESKLPIQITDEDINHMVQLTNFRPNIFSLKCALPTLISLGFNKDDMMSLSLNENGYNHFRFISENAAKLHTYHLNPKKICQTLIEQNDPIKSGIMIELLGKSNLTSIDEVPSFGTISTVFTQPIDPILEEFFSSRENMEKENTSPSQNLEVIALPKAKRTYQKKPRSERVFNRDYSNVISKALTPEILDTFNPNTKTITGTAEIVKALRKDIPVDRREKEGIINIRKSGNIYKIKLSDKWWPAVNEKSLNQASNLPNDLSKELEQMPLSSMFTITNENPIHYNSDFGFPESFDLYPDEIQVPQEDPSNNEGSDQKSPKPF